MFWASRRPQYIPKPVPIILTMKAVTGPASAPSAQPAYPPTVAPTNPISLVIDITPGRAVQSLHEDDPGVLGSAPLAAGKTDSDLFRSCRSRHPASGARRSSR